jgi:hypothetical protein
MIGAGDAECDISKYQRGMPSRFAVLLFFREQAILMFNSLFGFKPVLARHPLGSAVCVPEHACLDSVRSSLSFDFRSLLFPPSPYPSIRASSAYASSFEPTQ